MEPKLLEQIQRHFIDAIKKGEFELVKYFVENFEELDLNFVSPCGKTPLIWAIFKKRTDIALYLLEYSEVDYNELDANGTSPLMWACITENTEVVDALLAKENLDIHQHDAKKNTAFGYAVYLGNKNIVYKMLEEHKESIRREENLSEMIKIAVKHNNMEIATKLKMQFYMQF